MRFMPQYLIAASSYQSKSTKSSYIVLLMVNHQSTSAAQKCWTGIPLYRYAYIKLSHTSDQTNTLCSASCTGLSHLRGDDSAKGLPSIHTFHPRMINFPHSFLQSGFEILIWVDRCRLGLSLPLMFGSFLPNRNPIWDCNISKNFIFLCLLVITYTSTLEMIPCALGHVTSSIIGVLHQYPIIGQTRTAS